MDRKTRKIMAMNRMYHPQSDTDRMYMPRMEGGRGLLNIAEFAETEEQNLSLYLDQSGERLLRFFKSERISPQLLLLLLLLLSILLLSPLLLRSSSSKLSSSSLLYDIDNNKRCLHGSKICINWRLKKSSPV